MSKLSAKHKKEIQVFKQIDRNEFETICGRKFSSYFNNYSSEELIYQIQLLLKRNENLSMGIKYSQKNQIDQLTIKILLVIDRCYSISVRISLCLQPVTAERGTSKQYLIILLNLCSQPPQLHSTSPLQFFDKAPSPSIVLTMSGPKG